MSRGTILFIIFWAFCLSLFIATFYVKFPEFEFGKPYTSILDYKDAYASFYYYLGWCRIILLMSLVVTPFCFFIIMLPATQQGEKEKMSRPSGSRLANIVFIVLIILFFSSVSSYLTLRFVGLQMDSGPFWERTGELWSLRLTGLMNVTLLAAILSGFLLGSGILVVCWSEQKSEAKKNAEDLGLGEKQK